MDLLLSTHNRHKAEEIAPLLPAGFALLTLTEAGITGDVEEDATDLAGNALIKARWAAHELAKTRDKHDPAADGNSHAAAEQRTTAAEQCLVAADDTGLEVNALGGAPGVLTARYAGEHCTPNDNIDKLLAALQDAADRRATFRTVVALITPDGQEHLFEGVCPGHITTARQGQGGFGYDPVFAPDGLNGRTFAEMTLQEKNRVSHRGRALRALAAFLRQTL